MDNIALQNKKVYRVILWVLLIISLLALSFLAPTLSKPEYLRSDDFMTYWAGGKLNLSGENPYDAQKKESLQLAQGGQASDTYLLSIMLNPPWVVSIVMPLGLINYPISRLIWLLLSIGSILFCGQLFWRFYKGPPKQIWLAWLIIILFAPSSLVLQIGQISPLILLGITLFLYFTLFNTNEWAAGASLSLVSVKPQVVYIFLLVLLFWVIKQRRWRILVSFV
jgi:hypothetical protein